MSGAGQTVLVGIVIGIFLTAFAPDDGPPRYAVAAYCQKIGNVAGGSAAIERGCMDNEQQAYNSLKANWALSSASKNLLRPDRTRRWRQL